MASVPLISFILFTASIIGTQYYYLDHNLFVTGISKPPLLLFVAALLSRIPWEVLFCYKQNPLPLFSTGYVMILVVLRAVALGLYMMVPSAWYQTDLNIVDRHVGANELASLDVQLSCLAILFLALLTEEPNRFRVWLGMFPEPSKLKQERSLWNYSFFKVLSTGFFISIACFIWTLVAWYGALTTSSKPIETLLPANPFVLSIMLLDGAVAFISAFNLYTPAVKPLYDSGDYHTVLYHLARMYVLAIAFALFIAPARWMVIFMLLSSIPAPGPEPEKTKTVRSNNGGLRTGEIESS